MTNLKDKLIAHETITDHDIYYDNSTENQRGYPHDIKNMDGEYNKGIKRPDYIDLVHSINTGTPILNLCDSKVMNSPTIDIKTLSMDYDFDSARYTSETVKPYSDIEKVDPLIVDTEIVAKDYTVTADAYLIDAKYFDKGFDFFNTIHNEVVRGLQPAWERLLMYSDKNNINGSAGMKLNNGMLAICREIHKLNNDFGFAPVIFGDDVLTKSLEKVINKCTDIEMDLYDARLIVPSRMYNELFQEITQRETPYGDAVLRNELVRYFETVPIQTSRNLTSRYIRNGWNSIKVDDNGEISETGKHTIKNMQYAILSVPNNMISAIYPQYNGEQADVNTFTIGWEKRWILTADISGGFGIKNPQDTMIIPYTTESRPKGIKKDNA